MNKHTDNSIRNEAPESPLSGNHAFLDSVERILQANLKNEQFGVEDLASEMSISRFQMYRKINALTGQSISQFIREYRLKQALILLKESSETVSEISYRVGFGSPSYFNKCFHEYFGFPPGKVRSTLDGKHSGDIMIGNKEYEHSEKRIHTQKSNPESLENGHSTNIISRLPGNKLLKNLVPTIIVISIIITVWGLLTHYSNLFDQSHDAIEINRTIAVLPFTDMSPDKDQDYLSIGIMNEIIMHLVKIGDLNVTSRTSVMQYKGTVKTVPEIAKELSVANILQGSFWKEGNKIRITVELIDTKKDKNVWAESYDRNISDLLTIQSEVAQRVAEELHSKISSKTRRLIESRPTDSEKAYQLYLEAIYQYYTWTYEGSDKAEKLFEEVLEIDPGFAEVYAYLGNIRSAFNWATDNSRVSSTEEAVRVALPYYKKALEIDPDNVTAHKFLANMHLYFEWDFEKAQKEYETILKLEPNYCWIDLLLKTGRFEESDEKTKMQVQSDPLNPEVWIGRIYSLIYSNERDKALEYTEMLVQKDIGSYHYIGVSEFYLYSGKYEEAIKMVYNWFDNYPGRRPPRTLSILAIAYHFSGQEEKTSSIISELEDRSKNSSAGSPSHYLARYYAQTGKKDLALKWLEKAYQSHETEMVDIKSSPFFEPLHDDPGWQILLDKVGFPD